MRGDSGGGGEGWHRATGEGRQWGGGIEQQVRGDSGGGGLWHRATGEGRLVGDGGWHRATGQEIQWWRWGVA